MFVFSFVPWDVGGKQVVTKSERSFLGDLALGAENWTWKVNAAWELEGFVLKEMAIWRPCRWWVWNLHISRLQGISKSSSTANQLQYSDCILMLVMLPYPETTVLPDRCDDIMSCQDTYWMGHDLSLCQWMDGPLEIGKVRGFSSPPPKKKHGPAKWLYKVRFDVFCWILFWIKTTWKKVSVLLRCPKDPHWWMATTSTFRVSVKFAEGMSQRS